MSPNPPGEAGQPSGVQVAGIASGVDTIEGGRLIQPVVLLARTPEEAALVAESAPPSAQGYIRDWAQFGQRSLLLVTGGLQPDPSYRISVRSISVLELGRKVVAFAIIRKEGEAAEAFSVPWALVAIPAPAAVLAKRCVLGIEGEASVNSRCR